MHPLDTEKAKGAHDNPSFIGDSGNTQSHWKNKSEKGKSKTFGSIFLFTDKHVVH
jgi:hypothetical protein